MNTLSTGRPQHLKIIILEEYRLLGCGAGESRGFTARGFVYSEDEGDTFLRNVG
jgi:hypothetical protein